MNTAETFTFVNDGIRLCQNPAGLTYGTDAYLLSAFVRESPKARAAEFGSGTGIISLLLARRNKLRHITAYEAQPYYADLTARNIALNGLSDRITAVCGDIRTVRAEPYDVIFTNPPYIRADAGKRNTDDGKYAARHEVFGGICDFCAAASRLLRYGGSFYAVYRPDRLPDLLCAMRENAIEPKCLLLVFPTPAHKPCLMLVEGKRGGRSGCDTMPPLFLYRPGTTRLTEEAEKIYRCGSFRQP